MRIAPPHSVPKARPWMMRTITSRIGAAMPTVGVGGQEPDDERGQAHQDQGRHVHRLASDLIAQMTADDAADRAGGEADTQRRERQQRARDGIGAREEGGAEVKAPRRCRTR